MVTAQEKAPPAGKQQSSPLTFQEEKRLRLEDALALR